MTPDPTLISIKRGAKAISAAFAMIIAGMVATIFFPDSARDVLLPIAAGLGAFGVLPLIRYWRAKAWIPVTATVLQLDDARIDVVVGPASIRHFYPYARYSYLVNGIQYTSERVSFEIENIWVDDAQARYWREWGNTVTAYYNPKAPGQAVIIHALRRSRLSHHLALITGVLLVLGVWAWLSYLS